MDRNWFVAITAENAGSCVVTRECGADGCVGHPLGSAKWNGSGGDSYAVNFLGKLSISILISVQSSNTVRGEVHGDRVPRSQKKCDIRRILPAEIALIYIDPHGVRAEDGNQPLQCRTQGVQEMERDPPGMGNTSAKGSPGNKREMGRKDRLRGAEEVSDITSGKQKQGQATWPPKG